MWRLYSLFSSNNSVIVHKMSISLAVSFSVTELRTFYIIFEKQKTKNCDRLPRPSESTECYGRVFNENCNHSLLLKRFLWLILIVDGNTRTSQVKSLFISYYHHTKIFIGVCHLVSSHFSKYTSIKVGNCSNIYHNIIRKGSLNKYTLPHKNTALLLLTVMELEVSRWGI
jgi:hypothetical protein